MKTPQFNVTYSLVTPESAQYGDYADSGYVLKNCRLRIARLLHLIP